MRQIDREFSPQGEGNVVSIEFNFLYRWHATISEQDAAWTEQEFSRMFAGNDLAEVRLSLRVEQSAQSNAFIGDPATIYTISRQISHSSQRYEGLDIWRVRVPAY